MGHLSSLSLTRTDCLLQDEFAISVKAYTCLNLDKTNQFRIGGCRFLDYRITCSPIMSIGVNNSADEYFFYIKRV